MMRMLGPHPAIRLERLRTELDDELEQAMHATFSGRSSQASKEAGTNTSVKRRPTRQPNRLVQTERTRLHLRERCPQCAHAAGRIAVRNEGATPPLN